MKRAVIVGGASGIGLSLLVKLLDSCDYVYVVDRNPIDFEAVPDQVQQTIREKTSYIQQNLADLDVSIFDDIVEDVDCLLITAGFGRTALFEKLSETEISNLVKVNTLGIIQIIRKFYSRIKSSSEFYCAVMVSIAGRLASPFFSVYGATKGALAIFIESVNAELAGCGYENRILDVSPGKLSGTKFDGKGSNDLSQTELISGEIVRRMLDRQTLYIPDYETVYKNVLERHFCNPDAFGLESFQYKFDRGRIDSKSPIVKGYLSGTFDLFHIGHLNIIKRAKAMCDYLVVGVHASGAWKGKETFIPLEERKAIVGAIKYVDKVITACDEDSDVWEFYQYDRLFVGSDYKGTERFKRYEELFKPRNVEIVYFPYTQGTSSTQLRSRLE